MKTGQFFALGFVVGAGLMLGGASGGGAPPSEERVFKDTQGREIVARIVSASAQTVAIETGDGKKFELPVAKFSEADRKFIADWREKNPPAIKYRFAMTDDRSRVSREQSKKNHEVTTEEEWLFKLKLTNTSGTDLEGLQARYRIFISEPVRGDTRARTTLTMDGALGLATLENNRDVEFATKEFKITINELVDGYYWADGGKGERAQKIEGIWVKLFHDGANVLDYKSGNSEVKNANWPDEKALAVQAEEK